MFLLLEERIVTCLFLFGESVFSRLAVKESVSFQLFGIIFLFGEFVFSQSTDGESVFLSTAQYSSFLFEISSS